MACTLREKFSPLPYLPVTLAVQHTETAAVKVAAQVYLHSTDTSKWDRAKAAFSAAASELLPTSQMLDSQVGRVRETETERKRPQGLATPGSEAEKLLRYIHVVHAVQPCGPHRNV